MTQITKIILVLSLLTIAQAETAAGRFARSAWNFVKSPMTLGVTGSASLYMISQEMKKNHYDTNKSYAIQQDLLDNLLILQKMSRDLDDPEENASLALIQTKNDIRHILAEKHNASPDFVVFNNDYYSSLNCVTDKDTFGIIIGCEMAASPQHLEHIVGHEYAHFNNKDIDTGIVLGATLPVATATAYRIPQWAGRGGKLASLALAGITACIVHPLARGQFSQFCEHRADREASSDPEVIEAGAKDFEEQEFREERLKKIIKLIDPTIIVDKDKNHLEKKWDELICSHPTNVERAKRLHEQAAKLRAEQDKNK